MNQEMLALTGDLNPNQFQALLQWLWLNSAVPSVPNLKEWRKTQGLT